MRRATLCCVLALGLVGCGDDGIAVPGGDTGRGKQAIVAYGCAGCHELPGVEASGGRVGPSLVDLHERRFIAGDMTTTPAHLTSWIRDPKRFDPDTLMPEFAMSERQARDIAAYLLSDP